MTTRRSRHAPVRLARTDSTRRPDMNRTGFGKRWLACAALLAGGCGALPEFIVDAAWLSAKEAVQEAVGDAVDGAIDDTIGVLPDFDDLELPFGEQGEDEENSDAFEDDGAD